MPARPQRKVSTRDERQTDFPSSQVWVTWESVDGPKNTAGRLVNLNDSGYLALSVDGGQRLWIALARIYSVSTSLGAAADTLVESTAAAADAAIQAAADHEADTSAENERKLV